MKITAVILLSVSLQAWAEGFGQTVTVNVEKVPIARVFNIIEKQSDFVFFFDQSLIAKRRKGNCPFPQPAIEKKCWRNASGTSLSRIPLLAPS